eukprot:scaffold26404_cov129-Isochrysis_galbana.AAC.1
MEHNCLSSANPRCAHPVGTIGLTDAPRPAFSPLARIRFLYGMRHPRWEEILDFVHAAKPRFKRAHDVCVWRKCI